MAARPRILCIGDHFETTAEGLRGAGFDVMLAPNAQAARALIHLYPPAAVLGDHKPNPGNTPEASRDSGGCQPILAEKSRRILQPTKSTRYWAK